MYNDYSMMNPGGPGGVSITGKWVNKRTGETVLVRDNIIGENGMQIRCSNGKFINMQEFSRDYIQASDEIYDINGNVVGNESPTKNELMCDLTPVKPQIQNENITQNTTQNINNKTLIEKVFNKIDSKPNIELKISWADFPEQEINTLINFLDISMDEISDYIYNTYLDKNAVREKLNGYLSNYCVD